jgi:hypothetical protein
MKKLSTIRNALAELDLRARKSKVTANGKLSTATKQSSCLTPDPTILNNG